MANENLEAKGTLVSLLVVARHQDLMALFLLLPSQHDVII